MYNRHVIQKKACCEYSTHRKRGQAIWYLVRYPRQWEEKKILGLVQNYKKNGIIQDFFAPFCLRMKRYQGEWHLERQMLVPFSIFLETNKPDELLMKESLCFSEMPAEKKEQNMIPMDVSIVKALRKLCGAEQGIGFSRGYIHRGKTFVTEGPLKGKEGLIRRIDRHKRLAKVELPVPGGMVDVGLEIYAKD